MPRVKYLVSYVLEKGKRRSKTKTAAITDAIRRAARVFVEHVYPRVPVDTGMARGSLIPLAEWAGTTIPLTGAVPKYDSSGHIKDAALGAIQAKGPELVEQNRTITFIYDTRVYHYWLRDLYAVGGKKHPTPWRSFELAAEIYRDALVRETEAALAEIVSAEAGTPFSRAVFKGRPLAERNRLPFG